MRSYPLDSDRIRLLSTGNVSPMQAWVVLADGSRRPDPTGRQALDEITGAPQWSVEVIAPADVDDPRDKTEVVAVTVSSHDRPEVGEFGTPVVFAGLMLTPGYVNRKTGQLSAPRWTASGTASTRSGNGRATATPAASS